MGTLKAFMFISLDGYYKGPEEDISWHKHGPEENAYAAEMLRQGDTLLFGRITYQLMAGYWSGTGAIENDPAVASGMNQANKIVFSRTLKKAGWNNTRVLSEDMGEEIKKMKQATGRNMTLLGSGNILTQLAGQNLIDEYQFMINPLLLGKGTPVFYGLRNKLDLTLTLTRTFKSGIVLLCYRPA